MYPPLRHLVAPNQLLAMWLSWVRALHTADGTLRLSRPLFRAIEEWAGKEGERTERRRGDMGQWVPMPPDRGQRYAEGAADGDGAAVMESEPGEATPSTVTARAGGGTETALGDRRASKAREGAGEARKGEEGELESSDTAATAAAGGEGKRGAGGTSKDGRSPDTDSLEAEEMMLKAEREERAKVVELVEKLVADFGRFPLAEQDWEGVREGSEKQGERGDLRGKEPASEGGVAVGSAPGTGEAGGGDGGETVSISENTGGGGEDQSPEGSGDHGNDEGNLDRSQAHASGNTSEGGHGDAPEALLAAATRKALALKVEGNESFGKGDLEEARDKYNDALDVLDAAPAASAAPWRSPSRNEATEGESLETATAEAAALRGVLHRNRAAVALRLFESKAAVAAAAAAAKKKKKDGKPMSASKNAPAGGGSSSDLQEDSAAPGPAAGEDNGAPSSGKETIRPQDEKWDGRLALESSLALLEGCESDCLKAIEVDAGDKKARLRLDKCRDLRRRCYRGGLASAAAGRDGCSTVYSRQDERCLNEIFYSGRHAATHNYPETQTGPVSEVAELTRKHASS